MTVKLFGLEFADEDDRDRALLELKESLDRIDEAEQQAWADHDYKPVPREYEQCESCGGIRTLRHHCDLIARLKAFGTDCLEHGDMTPSARDMLYAILGVSA